MSTADDFPFSVAQQKAWISADLNSTLLLQFLFGIYTGLFPATMYIYIHKENRMRARDMVIIGSTTVLYLATALSTVINWLYTNILFGTHGGTRVEIFMESLIQDLPLGQKIIDNLIFFGGFLFADGLLVWRCFYACGRSFRRSLIPIALLTVEIDMAVYYAQLSVKEALQNHYQGLFESSALYTITVLLQAIVDLNMTGDIESSYKAFLVSNFVDAASQILSGLVPTLMIARLFASSHKEDTEGSSACLPSDLIDGRASLGMNTTTNPKMASKTELKPSSKSKHATARSSFCQSYKEQQPTATTEA
ncbi:hypothetical protein CPC08DRAFT_780419 [Agrocybe pediades]|nr:hypothetical protein CPC08DRAFT_780419 [Agrocybe pediades]